MAFDPNNPYDYTGKSVSERVRDIISKDSPLVRQAQQGAMQQANRRGLMNSSIAAGEGRKAVLGVATPIASQESAEESQRFQGSQGLLGSREQIGSTEKIANMNIKASLAEKAGASATALEAVYGQQFASIMANESMGSAARENYLAHIGRMRDSQMALLEQMYGVNLEWSTPLSPTPAGKAPQASQSGKEPKAVKKPKETASTKTSSGSSSSPPGGKNYRILADGEIQYWRDGRWQ